MKKLLALAIMALNGLSAFAYNAYSVIDSTDVVYDTTFIDVDVFIVDTIYNRKIYYNLWENEAEVTYLSKQTTTAGSIYSSDYYGDIVIPETLTWGEKTYCVTGITDHAFYDCAELTSVTIPKTVKYIGEQAFFQCSMMTSVALPDNLKTIGKEAFYGCSGLTSISVPKAVTSISEGAFWTCGNLSTIMVDEGNGVYDSRNSCNAIIETATNTLISGCMNTVIPDDVTAIGNYAFTNCTGLTSISFPKGLRSIGKYSFCFCEGLTSIVIPDNVTTIGNSAFRECYGLKSYVLGSGIQRIDNGAFDVNQPRNMLIRATTPPTINRYTFSSFTFERTMLYIPIGTLDDYQYANIWYWFDNIREVAIKQEQLSTRQTYLLMDANTFAYTVYDSASDDLATVNSISSTNNNDPNHCWQMIEADGKHLLYNIGAKRYLKKAGNDFALTDNPEPIDVEDYDNGIALGGQLSRQWAFYPAAIMGDVNGDGEVDLSDAIMVTYYSLHVSPANFIETAADMNGDGEIDLSDAISIIYRSLGVK